MPDEDGSSSARVCLFLRVPLSGGLGKPRGKPSFERCPYFLTHAHIYTHILQWQELRDNVEADLKKSVPELISCPVPFASFLDRLGSALTATKQLPANDHETQKGSFSEVARRFQQKHYFVWIPCESAGVHATVC